MAGQVVYTLTQGDCLHVDVEPLDDDDQPYDLTGASVEIGVAWPGGAWSDDTSNGVNIVNGVITAEVPSATTALLPAGRRARLQVRIIDSTGCPLTIVEGRLRVRRKSL